MYDKYTFDYNENFVMIINSMVNYYENLMNELSMLMCIEILSYSVLMYIEMFGIFSPVRLEIISYCHLKCVNC